MERNYSERLVRRCELLKIQGDTVLYTVDYPQESRQTVVKLRFPHKEVIEETHKGKWQMQYHYAAVWDQLSHSPSSYTKHLFDPKTSRYDIVDFCAERIEIKQGGRMIFKVKETGEIQIRDVSEFSFIG